MAIIRLFHSEDMSCTNLCSHFGGFIDLGTPFEAAEIEIGPVQVPKTQNVFITRNK